MLLPSPANKLRYMVKPDRGVISNATGWEGQNIFALPSRPAYDPLGRSGFTPRLVC